MSTPQGPVTSVGPAMPSGPVTSSEQARVRTVPGWRLALVQARYQFTETVRVPIAVIGTGLFPGLALLFFIVPFPEVANDPIQATGSAVQLSIFAVMSVCLFTFGAGIAEDRALSWDGYLRTLPAGPIPRLFGRVANGLFFSILSLLPLVLIAALLTDASLPASRMVLTLGALIAAALPFLFGGFAIGYWATPKAALAVAQLLLIPLAFAGGLFMPPTVFPAWLGAISRFTPSRAGRELVVTAATGTSEFASVDLGVILVLVGWTALAAVLAVRAYIRDEGRRFS